MRLRYHISQYSDEAKLIIDEADIYKADLTLLHETVEELRSSAEALCDLTLPEHAIAVGINQLADAVEKKERNLFKQYQDFYSEHYQVVAREETVLLIAEHAEVSA